ncbi:MAG: YitT family protein [Oscillospiraceae bacterium]|nr:YitT family protein [Oscillospiraceae bacterium]MBR6596318.1 YitT family protein [Oscillospiraceae bacterium]
MLKNSKFFSLALVLLGNIVYAFSVKLFLLPANLISCGTTGIALVVNHLTDIPLSGFILGFNLVMLVVGLVFLGKTFALTTVFSSLFYPVALEVLNRMLGDIQVTQDLLLNTLFAGLGLGLSLGMVIRGGASTGGMDIPPLVLKKLFHIPVSVTLWAFDFCIMLAQMAFHTLEDLLYGLLLLMVISFALNKVLLLGTSRTEVKIISARSDDIRLAILSRVDRGVTILHGEGGYLRAPTEVILSVVSNHEMPKIERLAREIDPECFIIVSRVTEVWGRGFSVSKHYNAGT